MPVESQSSSQWWPRLLAWVDGYLLDHRYAPTVREVADEMGWPSTSTAHDRLHELRTAGVLDFEPGQARTLHVTEAGRRIIGTTAREIARLIATDA
jgi:SOS-response transcriptional repressor LexA